ncbi:hypothetical protein ACQPZ8_47445 [Actinomadura nitritigenes]
MRGVGATLLVPSSLALLQGSYGDRRGVRSDAGRPDLAGSRR